MIADGTAGMVNHGRLYPGAEGEMDIQRLPLGIVPVHYTLVDRTQGNLLGTADCNRLREERPACNLDPGNQLAGLQPKIISRRSQTLRKIPVKEKLNILNLRRIQNTRETQGNIQVRRLPLGRTLLPERILIKMVRIDNTRNIATDCSGILTVKIDQSLNSITTIITIIINRNHRSARTRPQRIYVLIVAAEIIRKKNNFQPQRTEPEQRLRKRFLPHRELLLRKHKYNPVRTDSLAEKRIHYNPQTINPLGHGGKRNYQSISLSG